MVDKFKGVIMAIVKVLGLYQSISYHGIKSIFIGVVLFPPLLPVIYHTKKSDDFESISFSIIFIVVYIICTAYIGHKLAEIAKKWSQDEFNEMTLDLAISRFVFVQLLYSVLVYFVYIVFKYLFI